MTLQEILEFAKAHKACAAQYSKFIFFIESGDDLQAWQTVLGNIVWLKNEGLEIELSDVIQITNIAKTWYENGRLCNCYTYKNGKPDGLYEYWYENGQLWERCNYKNGKRDGLYESWWDSGQLCQRYMYKKGKQDGLYESWDEDGQLYKRYTCKNDRRDGLYESWCRSGQLRERRTYKNGELIEELK